KQKAIWILPIAVAAAIIWLSHQPSLPMGVSLPPPLDKVAHFSAFGTLAVCLEWALRWTRHDLPVYRRHLFIFLAVACFGAMDEWHQHFVPGRASEFSDWVADATGALFGLGLTSLPFLWSRRLASFGWWRGEQKRPDQSRPLILVADAHWCEELTGLREATNAHSEADWLFLGDVFDVWVGVPGMQTETQRSFLWWVEERRAAGRWVGLWMGNREYFLDTVSQRFSLLGEGIEGSLPSENLAWEHGDLLNTQDHQYRFWCLISRSGFVWLLVRLLPGRLASALAIRLEQGMRTTNRAYKLAFPREAFRSAAALHDQAVFLTGHFHTHEVEGNGISLPWAHEGTFMVWQHGRVEPLG
ncbi:MAG: VanZ family protein, partial [Holophaga sp.]|nr:VanZ family protein [Holophaga sp.]